MPENPVNLHEVDSDPRKTKAVQQLIASHYHVGRLWRDAGLLRRKSDGTRQHDAWEHMTSGALHVAAIGQILEEKGQLDIRDTYDLEEAFLVHDFDKDTETAVVNVARSDEVNWDKVEEIIRAARPIYASLPTEERINRMRQYDDFENETLARLRTQYAGQLQPSVKKGGRIYIARDLVVGGWHDAKLKFEGVSDELIEAQATTEYSACPEVDRLIDEFDNLESKERKQALTRIVVFVTDNAMSNSEFVDHEARLEIVFAKPNNVPLSEAYAKYSGTGETAKEIQKRVGQKAIDLLSKLIDVKPENFVKAVEQRVQRNIAGI